jgi:subtilisin family serine protease
MENKAFAAIAMISLLGMIAAQDAGLQAGTSAVEGSYAKWIGNVRSAEAVHASENEVMQEIVRQEAAPAVGSWETYFVVAIAKGNIGVWIEGGGDGKVAPVSNLVERPELTEEEEQELFSLIIEHGGEPAGKFEALPAVYYARFKRSRDAQTLSQEPMVHGVYPIHSYRPLLYQSRAAVGADLANAQFNSGGGVKVAVIDTGVDYSNPNFRDPMYIGGGGRADEGAYFGGEPYGDVWQDFLFMNPWERVRDIPFRIPEGYSEPLFANMIFVDYFSYPNASTQGGAQNITGPDFDLYLYRPSEYEHNLDSLELLASSERGGWRNFTEEMYVPQIDPGQYILRIERKSDTAGYYRRFDTGLNSIVNEPARISVAIGSKPRFIIGSVYANTSERPNGAIESNAGYRLGRFSYRGVEYNFTLSDTVAGDGQFYYGYDALSADMNGDGNYSDFQFRVNRSNYVNGLGESFRSDNLRGFETADAYRPGGVNLIANSRLFPAENFTLGIILSSEIDQTYQGGNTPADSVLFNGNKVLFSQTLLDFSYRYPPTFTLKEPADISGHGTHVAGILASEGNLMGIAPKVRVYNAKVFGGYAQGQGNDIALPVCFRHVQNQPDSKMYCHGVPLAFEDNVIAAMEGARASGARVVSLSIGNRTANCSDSLLVELIGNFSNIYNIIVVAAAGNDGSLAGTIHTPGCAQDAITVGATGRDGQVAGYSSRGPTDYGAVKPDLVAPGGDRGLMQPYVIDGVTYGIMNPNGIAATKSREGMISLAYFANYSNSMNQRMTGTSMSVPHVSGTVAMMLHENPSLTPAQIKQMLMSAATNLSADPNAQGAGMLNAYEAVRAAHEMGRTGNPVYEEHS